MPYKEMFHYRTEVFDQLSLKMNYEIFCKANFTGQRDFDRKIYVKLQEIHEKVLNNILW